MVHNLARLRCGKVWMVRIPRTVFWHSVLYPAPTFSSGSELLASSPLVLMDAAFGGGTVAPGLSKQMVWMLGICGIMVALATIGILVKHSFDKETIVAAIQEKSKYEALMLDLKQWAKENPRGAKSFRQWTEKISK